MQLESINCNHCGAPLEVAAQAKFVTCRHCHAQLAIKRTASSAFTEEIERLSETTDRLSDQMAQISYDNALERLDREWETEQKQYMSRRKDGSEYVPTTGGAIGMAVVGGIFGLIWLAMTARMGFVIAPFGVLFILGAIVLGALSYNKARRHDEAKDRYLRRRRDLAVDDFRHADDRGD